MVDNTFSNNLKEVYVVLEKLEILKKLPNKFVQFIIENKNDEYKFEYENNKKLMEQNISEESKQILTVIYQDFLCTKEQSDELNKILIQIEKREQEELSKKYSYEKLFPKQEENQVNQIIQENTQMIEYKENIFKRFINWLEKIKKKIKQYL